MQKKVLCAGIVVGDFIMKPVSEMPERGKLKLVERTELHIGGCASNTAVVLRKMGIDVALAGKLGQDNLGRFVLQKLQEEGVDISGVKTMPDVNTSGTGVMVHPDGERSFLHSIGTNAFFSAEDIDPDYMKNFDIAHFAGICLIPKLEGKSLARLAEKAKELGLTVCVDTAWDARGRWLKMLEEALPFFDYFLPSIEEARMITGRDSPEDVAGFLLDRGVKNVGLKMGGQGSFVMNRQEKHYFPALKFNVVDTTGCGDGYVAGFIAGLVKGFSFQKCGLLANLTGAKIATAMGTTAGVKSWADLINFGKQHGLEV